LFIPGKVCRLKRQSLPVKAAKSAGLYSNTQQKPRRYLISFLFYDTQCGNIAP